VTIKPIKRNYVVIRQWYDHDPDCSDNSSLTTVLAVAETKDQAVAYIKEREQEFDAEWHLPLVTYVKTIIIDEKGYCVEYYAEDYELIRFKYVVAPKLE
jgi:hypothetical protein